MGFAPFPAPASGCLVPMGALSGLTPRVSIAIYPARFGLKEYDSINDRFEAIVDGLVQSGLFQLQSSFFNEDYLDPQSATDP